MISAAITLPIFSSFILMVILNLILKYHNTILEHHVKAATANHRTIELFLSHYSLTWYTLDN